MESGKVGRAVGGAMKGDESGLEETIIKLWSSQVTMEMLQITSSENKSDLESDATTPLTRSHPSENRIYMGRAALLAN